MTSLPNITIISATMFFGHACTMLSRMPQRRRAFTRALATNSMYRSTNVLQTQLSRIIKRAISVRSHSIFYFDLTALTRCPVWVNDYHLMLVPQLVRAKLPTAIIGFFLHVAFPSSEIFRCLSVRQVSPNSQFYTRHPVPLY